MKKQVEYAQTAGLPPLETKDPYAKQIYKNAKTFWPDIGEADLQAAAVIAETFRGIPQGYMDYIEDLAPDFQRQLHIKAGKSTFLQGYDVLGMVYNLGQIKLRLRAPLEAIQAAEKKDEDFPETKYGPIIVDVIGEITGQQLEGEQREQAIKALEYQS